MKRLLLVEDDFDVRETIAEILVDEGYDVATAIDGRQALERLRSGAPHPDLILLDLMMAGMDGFEFRSQQRRDPAIAKIPVIVLTADRHIEQRAAELGVAAYLRKPTPLDQLLATIRSLL